MPEVPTYLLRPSVSIRVQHWWIVEVFFYSSVANQESAPLALKTRQMGLMRFPPPTYQISGGLNLPALDLQLAYIGNGIYAWHVWSVPVSRASFCFYSCCFATYLRPMSHAAVVR